MRKGEMKNAVAMLGALSLASLFAASGAMAAPDRERGIRIGEPAPAFSLPDRYGNEVSLSDYLGKKVILYFWVSWCVCRDQLPLLQQFKDSHPDDSFEIISVSIDAQGGRYVNPIADTAKIRYPALLDARAETARLYHYPATPAAFLIDEAGVATGQFILDFELQKSETREALEGFLARPAVASPEFSPRRASIDELQADVRNDPRNPKARMRLAGAFQSSGDAVSAIPHWEALCEIKKNDCEYKFSLGSAHFAAGNLEQALKHWKNAAKCDQTNYIYMRTVQSFEHPGNFYSPEKMKDLYSDGLEQMK